MTRRVITAREQHEMLSPWREAAPDPAHQERVRRMYDRDWAQRSLTPAQQRQQHAEGINDSATKLEWDSRPKEGDEDYETGPEQLSQPTLPGMEKIRGESTRLWRGLQVDTWHPNFRKVWQMTYGQGEPVKDPGLFPDADLRHEDRGGRFDHPGLADAILEGLHASGGAGEHHSTGFDTADNYGWGYGDAQGSSAQEWREEENLPVLMDADWNGSKENYGRAGSGNYGEEKEIMLERGAPLKLQDLRVPHNTDEYPEWNSILDGPRAITAREQHEMLMPWHQAAAQNMMMPIEEIASYFVHTPPPAEYASSKRHPGLPEDIAQNGVRDPLTVVSDGTWAHLSDGYHRAAEALRQGITHLPVVIQGREPKDYLRHHRLNPVADTVSKYFRQYNISPDTSQYGTDEHRQLQKIYQRNQEISQDYYRQRGWTS